MAETMVKMGCVGFYRQLNSMHSSEHEPELLSDAANGCLRHVNYLLKIGKVKNQACHLVGLANH